MAGFCRSCGSPLGDAQAFCSKCGAQAQRAPTQPAASAAPTVAPPAATQPTVATPPSKGSPLVKILLIVVGIFVVFMGIGVAAVFYIGHRIHDKAVEMGLNSDARRDAAIANLDACALLSKDDVSQVIGMPVVRTEKTTGGNPGCMYVVSGNAADLTAKHLSQVNKTVLQDNNQDLSKPDQQKMEEISKQFFHGMQGEQSGTLSDHPGEAPVLSFEVDGNAAVFQMKLNRGMLAQVGPLATKNIPDLGDEAFDMSGAILMFRKGDRLVRIMYTTCPCGRDDVIGLAKKIASGL
jgi:hypothetical protein